MIINKEWDRNYVRNKYGFNNFSFDGIFYPSKNPQRLLVFFSSMGKDRYDRYSWFWDPTEKWDNGDSFLFIKDDSFHYFLGTDEYPKRDSIKKLIQYYQNINIDKPIPNEKTFCIGGSMGGYAAIFFACYCSLKAAIVSNPQITYEATKMHKYFNWENRIREIGNQFYDLNIWMQKFEHTPYIYMEYGNYPADKEGCEKLVKTLLSRKSMFIIKRQDWMTHTVNSLTKNEILNAVNFFDNDPSNNNNQ